MNTQKQKRKGFLSWVKEHPIKTMLLGGLVIMIVGVLSTCANLLIQYNNADLKPGETIEHFNP